MALLTNKTAVITGGSGGMGAVISARLAESGANVAVVDIRAPESADNPLDKAKELGQRAKFYEANIADEASVQSLYASIQKDLGEAQILVNCAGLVGRRDSSITDPLEERQFYLDEPYEEWLKVMNVNIWGAELMVKYAFPQMKASGGGSIITISSLAGRFGAAAAALSYTASKAALVGLSKQWAKMFGRDAIRSNAIAPGPTRTPMLDSMPAHIVEKFQNATLTGRISEPEDIAKAVCFLASDESANITGQVLEINGGCWIPA